MRHIFVLILFALSLLPAFAAKDTCYECHLRLRGKLKAPTLLWANDVHRQEGMACIICHKGDASIDDLKLSKTSEFIGTFYRQDIARLCGDCHSDAERIHKVNAKLPLDQLAQYRSGAHGKRLASGDEAAATCIDCHSVHDIRKVSDPLAPVATTRQPDTCGRCHSNPEIMASRNLPVNQAENYRLGGHWMQFTMRSNAKVARCTSCHGDHEVAPAKTRLADTTCQPCHGSPEEVYQDRAHSRIEYSERSRGCVGCHGNHSVRRRPGGGRGGRGMRGRPMRGQ
jgi:hypothetical protein